MDISDELEQSFGHGPALPTPEERLVAGRAALRRRRRAVGGTAAVVAALLVTPFAIAAGGDPAVQPGPATPASTATADPSPNPTTLATEAPEEPPQQRWQKWETIRYSAEGELEIRPGVQILDRVDGYLRDSPRWDHSVAMEVRYDGGVYWVSAEWDRENGSSSGSTPANDGWADFRAWAASQAAVNVPDAPDPGNGYPELVQAGDDGTLVAAPGATLLEQQTSPDLPENFAPAGAATAAAYVERDGVRYLVLTRPGDVISVPSAGHGDSLDALLTWARERYESGEGLL